MTKYVCASDSLPPGQLDRMISKIKDSNPNESEEKMPNTLTCVYCGMAYPEGTPPHGAKILTDHIKVCEKHPMRKAEDTIAKLQKALEDLVGATTKAELKGIELGIRTLPAPDADKVAMINAIHVLLETAEEE